MKLIKRSFRGGYRFREFKGKPLGKQQHIKAPKSVLVPLAQGPREPVEPLVKIGDKVQAGQLIGRSDDSISSPVHASISGKVTAIESLGPAGREVSAVRIEAEAVDAHAQAFRRLPGYSAEWENLSPEALRRLIYLSGASGLDECGIPTEYRSAVIEPEEVEHIIVRAAEADVLSPDVETLLAEGEIERFITGLRILRRCFPKATFHVALRRDSRVMIDRLVEAGANTKAVPEAASSMVNPTKSLEGITIVAVSKKYPQTMDEVLIPSLLGRRFPYGYSAINIGVLVLGAQTMLHIHNAVVEGRAAIECTIALGGSGFLDPCHISVPIGISIKSVVAGLLDRGADYRLVFDSLMTGPTITELEMPITREASGIYSIEEKQELELLSFSRPGLKRDSYTNSFASLFLPFKRDGDTNIRGEHRACLSCGFCADVCPVGIQPNVLHRYVERGLVNETLQRLNIFHCIDCNLCTYVCPSKIPLARLMKEGKEQLNAEGLNDEGRIKASFDLKGVGS